MPKDPNSYINLALVEISSHRFPEAEQHLKQAIVVDPHFLPAYKNLANYYRAGQRLQQAEQVLQDAVEHTSDDTDLSVAWADVLFTEQNVDNAEEVVGRLRIKHKDSADVALAL